MRISEWIALIYYLYLSLVAWTRRVSVAPAGRAATAIAAIGVPLAALATTTLPGLRDWLPGIYLLTGYWLSGFFYSGPMTGVEQSLSMVDRWIFDRLEIDRRVRGAPRLILECLELSYLWCYPLVPSGLLALLAAGRRDLADWYWSVVLAAELSCYGVLPWIQTRPPRVIERDIAIDARSVLLRRVNRAVLDCGSIRVNTFPSGHAAGALAAALAVTPVGLMEASAFALLALSIATASVIGRYHYAADSFAGLLFAIIALVCVRSLWTFLGN